MDVAPFPRALRAIETGELAELAELISEHPFLLTARGSSGDDLVNLACASGSADALRLLLERGAAPDRADDRGWTALHQAAYCDRPDLAELLLAAGAALDRSAHGDGGTPLVVALFWGHAETAALLADHGLTPGNLRVAAGLGRHDLVEELLAPDGTLAPGAGAHRAFYRPHTGLPDWRPSEDPAEVRDEALAWATRNGQAGVLELLVARGARLDADPYRGTPLAWAAFNGRVDTVARLVELGADVDRRGTFGGPEHGEGITPLHLAAQAGHLPAVQALLDAGADVEIRDALYAGTAADWAEHGGHVEVGEAIRRQPG